MNTFAVCHSVMQPPPPPATFAMLSIKACDYLMRRFSLFINNVRGIGRGGGGVEPCLDLSAPARPPSQTFWPGLLLRPVSVRVSLSLSITNPHLPPGKIHSFANLILNYIYPQLCRQISQSSSMLTRKLCAVRKSCMSRVSHWLSLSIQCLFHPHTLCSWIVF